MRLISHYKVLWRTFALCLFALSLPNSVLGQGDTSLPYPFLGQTGGLYLNNPANYQTGITFDSETGYYHFTQQAGSVQLAYPSYMTQEEYQDYIFQQQIMMFVVKKIMNEFKK